jgi:hypothetical protein
VSGVSENDQCSATAWFHISLLYLTLAIRPRWRTNSIFPNDLSLASAHHVALNPLREFFTAKLTTRHIENN